MRDASAPRILILGASGFLGSRFARYLGRQGHFALRFGVRKRGDYGFETTARDEWVTFDLEDDRTFRAAVDGVDSIVHVAGPNAEQSAARPDRAMTLRGAATSRLLETAVASGVRRIVYFSTAHVYGSPLVGDLVESDSVRPRHPYALAHREAEERVLSFRTQIDCAVLRLSNALGAPAHAAVDAWMLVANDLCRMAVRDRVLVLKTSGLQYRNFIGLDDVERALEHFLRLDASRLGDGLFNLGGPSSIRVRHLAQRIAQLVSDCLGFHPEIQRPVATSDENPPEHRLVIDRLLSTGFRPSDSLDADLKQLISFCARSGGGTK